MRCSYTTLQVEGTEVGIQYLRFSGKNTKKSNITICDIILPLKDICAFCIFNEINRLNVYLNFDGGLPVIFLKTLEKYRGSEKPKCQATSEILYLPLESISAAA